MFSVHATTKLLDRVKQAVEASVPEPTPALGNWYATMLFWRPQVALFVNERTLLPVLLSLAPAATLMGRFPEALRHVLEAHGVDRAFVRREIAAVGEGRYSKTSNRSVVGIMNEFTYLADAYRAQRGIDDPVTLALELSRTPCGPLYRRHVSPDRELHALVTALEPG